MRSGIGVVGRGPLTRLDPRTKLLFTLLMLILLMFVKELVVLLLILVFVVSLFIVGRIDPSSLFKKIRSFFLFSILIFVTHVLFVHTGDVLAYWRITTLDITWTITIGGVMDGLTIALRFLNIILVSFLFISVTEPSKLARGLMKMGVPYRFAFMLVMAMRFVPLFQQESSQVKDAQRARGLSVDGSSMPEIWRMIRFTFMPILASSLSRADVLSISMDSRGFGMYKDRTFLYEVKLKWNDWAIILTMTVAVVIIFYLTFTQGSL